jgi:hypothetical protein
MNATLLRTIGFVLLLGYSLTGCMLASGELRSLDAVSEAGNTSVSFLSAEGSEVGAINIGVASTTYEVITIVSVEQGELMVEIFDGSGVPAYSVQGRPDQQITRSGQLSTNAEGELRFRVTARGARNGEYQILYRRIG